ncbi:hypothetical protein [Variovorax saccharolyticus]|uniref:hypothetical protein n=1 Tax=Variovorax saccharolyticus TaxID=3053516 RepID=UPI00257848D5|nr:hypothetical protein [Variovorax sp. J31P216]MDM0024814.1 hypothetical protein [Variovorax sp. J31P216]
MKTTFAIAAVMMAASIGMPSTAGAQQAADAALMAGEQQEADFRVIAARCGTPGFEKAFYKQSRAAVAAGLVVKNRDPVQVEKTVTSLRRSPVVLVATQADCAAELKRLAEVQKRRGELLKGKKK